MSVIEGVEPMEGADVTHAARLEKGRLNMSAAGANSWCLMTLLSFFAPLNRTKG